MSDSINKNDKIVVDLYDQKISKLPIEDPDELENVLINAAQKLADGNDAVILESLLNTLVDFYVFDLEPGDDIEDVGFLVSDIEDRVCNAVAFRRHLAENGSEDSDEGSDDDEDDENDDLPVEIPVIQTPCSKSCGACFRDSDDIVDKEIPGMMKRFECDGFEVTVTLVPKREFDDE